MPRGKFESALSSASALGIVHTERIDHTITVCTCHNLLPRARLQGQTSAAPVAAGSPFQLWRESTVLDKGGCLGALLGFGLAHCHYLLCFYLLLLLRHSLLAFQKAPLPFVCDGGSSMTGTTTCLRYLYPSNEMIASRGLKREFPPPCPSLAFCELAVWFAAVSPT